MGWWDERAKLAGTVAVVTGGAGGLGRAISTDLAANGVQVAVLDRDAGAVESLLTELDDRGLDRIGLVGDVRQRDHLEAVLSAATDRWGRLDTLVNVPGGTFRAPFAETTPKGWEALLDANLRHVLDACSLAIPLIRTGGRGGSIINITTIEAHRAAPGFAVYAAAKAAVTELARTLAVELAPDGIRVNNVAPDMTPTENLRRLSAGRSALDHPLGPGVAIPMGRTGTTEEVSGVVVFLASGLASYLTGATLHPDGGTRASGGFFNWPGTGFSNTVPPAVLDVLADLLASEVAPTTDPE